MTPFKPEDKQPSNGNGQAEKAKGGEATGARQRILDMAAKSDNPKLWLTKYDFYINVLKLSEEQAMNWADVDVSINTEARVEFDLPPAKSLRQDAA